MVWSRGEYCTWRRICIAEYKICTENRLQILLEISDVKNASGIKFMNDSA